MKSYACKILYLIIILTLYSKAQDFFYYGLNNFGGIIPALQNPANIADSRNKWDLILLGNHFDLGNNYLGLKPEALKGYGWFRFNNPNFSDTSFKTKYITKIQNGYQKEAFLNLRLMLPSFMISLNEKHSIAFTWSIRSLLNAYNVNQQLADLLYSDIRDNRLYNEDKNFRFSMTFNTFAEYGGTYARVLLNKRKNFIKSGISLKLLQGLGSIYAYADPLHYKFTSDTTVDIYNSQIGYGHSNNFDLVPDWIKRYKFNSKPSFGADIGIVYEFRPNFERYYYQSLDGKNFERRDQNKYLFKIAASLVDLGHITYEKSPDSQDFFANTTSWKFRKLATGQYPIDAIDDTIKNRFTVLNTNSKYKMHLPTSLWLQADFKILKNLYLNASSSINLQKKIFTANNKYNAHHFSIRYERPHLSGAFSLNYNDFLNTVEQPWSLGAMFHFWFLCVGTTNLNNLFYNRDIYGMNFFILFKTTPASFKKPEDKDKDDIPDIGDLCPTIAGSFKTRGCPDTDHDSISDINDECPTLSGNKRTNGCPDTDNDGVADKDDDCPNKAGLLKCKGCPYMDFDGIVLNTFNPNDISSEKIKIYLLDSTLKKLDSTYLNNGKFSFSCVQGKYDNILVMLDNNNTSVINKSRFYLMEPESKELRRVTKRIGNYNYIFGDLPLSKYEWYDLKGNGNLTLGGILLNAENNEPIRNKKIYIKNDKGDIFDSTKTNFLGSFVFRYLEPEQNYLFYLDEKDPELNSKLKIVLTNKQGNTLKTIYYNEMQKRFEFKILSAELTQLKDLELDDSELIYSLKASLTDTKKNPLANVKIYIYSNSGNDSLLQTIITDKEGFFEANNMKFMKGSYFLFDNNDHTLQKLPYILILDKGGRVIKVLKRNTEGTFKFNIPEAIKTTLVEFHIEDPWLHALNLINKQMTVIENIIYPSNEYKVTKEGERILAKVAQVLKENPDLMVEIGSHTDSRANDAYNLKLSQKRAQYVVDYLIKNGIQKERLKAIGYGETQILNHCKNKIKCSDIEHSVNRRTEFKIKKMN